MESTFSRKKHIYLFCLMLFSFSTVFSQVFVTGKVTDDKNEEIIGANVTLKGTKTGTITDVKGNFQIKVNDLGKDVLKISYMGYVEQQFALNGRSKIKIILVEKSQVLGEISVIAYGTQKKETLTGAVSSVQTEALLKSPNASIANSLAGQITGLSTNATSGQPGKEDPRIYIRGIGSLTDGASTPLILVDGVERSFFQMDPNEIESVTVLKDASATAVFGVRGANGVILVTTRRGQEGKAKISISSSFGITQPTRLLQTADSYTYAKMHNEMKDNDGAAHSFSDYALERFRLGDQPILYPNHNWRKEMLNQTSAQTQHNLNISGGNEFARYFVSVGFLLEDGLLKQFQNLDYDNNYKYKRYNYRVNLDLNLTKSTTLKLGLGGILGQTHQPTNGGTIFQAAHESPPFCSAGIVDGNLVVTPYTKYPGVFLWVNDGPSAYYNNGYSDETSNTMNLDLTLSQNLDLLTKGLSFEVKGAYNTTYSLTKNRTGMREGKYIAYTESELNGSGLKLGDPGYIYDIVYKVDMTSVYNQFAYGESNSRSRNWYIESSLRYNRKFGNHNFGGLLLFNQSKIYYPSQWTEIPHAYVGLVGRATYDYKTRYLAEVNVGYNGSENFPKSQRYGLFPAGSLGWIVTNESWMEKQKVIDYFKIRASVGLVGNDNANSNARFLYFADAYNVNQIGTQSAWKGYPHGYNFGYNSAAWEGSAMEQRMGNSNITWETSLKKNVGIDLGFLKNHLKLSVDLFKEDRKDILISRNTVPLLTGLTSSVLPVVNLGRVTNNGYEVEMKWDDRIKDLHYYISGNASFARNKIIEQDEVTPNEPYLWRTGKSVGAIFGYVSEGFYSSEDFETNGNLKAGNADPKLKVHPGDLKYKDLNSDGVINVDDQREIGYPVRPEYVFGLNYGADFKGWFFSMNWTAVTNRSLVLQEKFRIPFSMGGGLSHGLLQYHVDNRWTPETAATATIPRFAETSLDYNTRTSTTWVLDGSYLRLKTLTFGYNFTKSWLKNLGISQLGIKVTGYNLLTFDKFKLMDPECNPNLDDSYPVTKIYNLGININF